MQDEREILSDYWLVPNGPQHRKWIKALCIGTEFLEP